MTKSVCFLVENGGKVACHDSCAEISGVLLRSDRESLESFDLWIVLYYI